MTRTQCGHADVTGGPKEEKHQLYETVISALPTSKHNGIQNICIHRADNIQTHYTLYTIHIFSTLLIAHSTHHPEFNFSWHKTIASPVRWFWDVFPTIDLFGMCQSLGSDFILSI